MLQHGVVGETYNVGSGVEASIEEIADAVLAATGQAAVPEGDRARPPRATTVATCSTRPRSGRELGWEPTVPFEQGLADTVCVVRRQPELVGAAAGPGPGGRGLLVAGPGLGTAPAP